MKIYNIEIYYRCGTCSIGISNTPPQSKQGSKTVWIEKTGNATLHTQPGLRTTCLPINQLVYFCTTRRAAQRSHVKFEN